MNLAVIGSRDFTNYGLFTRIMDKLLQKKHISKIVSGGARGADKLAERYSQENDIPILILPALWDKHGKSAGYIRNHDIWKNSDLGIAFWNGKSKGTKHSFDIARKQGKRLYVWDNSTKTMEVI